MRTVGSIVAVALLASTAAQAGDDAVLPARAVPVAAASNDATVAWQPAPYPADWDKRIGDDFWTRFINYYALEWGHDGAPPDPTAPPGRLAGGTGEHAALSLHGMAVWWRDEHRRDQAELRG